MGCFLQTKVIFLNLKYNYLIQIIPQHLCSLSVGLVLSGVQDYHNLKMSLHGRASVP